jgi:hypothetical protein
VLKLLCNAEVFGHGETLTRLISEGVKARRLTVKVSPPNDMASRPSRDPTESGPTEVRSRCNRHIDPPPKAMLCTSGMLKFVLTPAILTKAEDCLGYPVFSNAQMSVVVLHIMSASQQSDRYTRRLRTRQRQQQELRFHQSCTQFPL